MISSVSLRPLRSATYLLQSRWESHTTLDRCHTGCAAGLNFVSECYPFPILSQGLGNDFRYNCRTNQSERNSPARCWNRTYTCACQVCKLRTMYGYWKHGLNRVELQFWCSRRSLIDFHPHHIGRVFQYESFGGWLLEVRS